MERLLLAALFFAVPARADMIGRADNRRHVEWDSEAFGAMVKLGGQGGLCSGAYVSPNIILTTRHCVIGTPFCGTESCQATNSKGQSFNAKIVMLGGADDRSPPRGTLNRDDWAFLAAPAPEFYSERFYTIYPGAQPLYAPGMTSAGFGALRLIADGEIAAIKILYSEYLRGEIARLGPKRVEELGSVTRLVAHTASGFDGFLAGRAEQTGVIPLFIDAGRLKAHEDCMIGYPADGIDGLFLVNHTCDNSAGDSGGPIIDRLGRVTAMLSRGLDSIYACPSGGRGADCPIISGEAESQAVRVDLFNLESRKLIR